LRLRSSKYSTLADAKHLKHSAILALGNRRSGLIKLGSMTLVAADKHRVEAQPMTVW